MAYLVDTNVMARWTMPRDPHYAACRRVVRDLRANGQPVYITPQNLMEYWAVATRPAQVNGFGLTVEQASVRMCLLQRNFQLLPDTPAIYPLWQGLVVRYGVIGRQVYDARIVAVMQAHNVTQILTLNGGHFRRFTEITVIDPLTLT